MEGTDVDMLWDGSEGLGYGRSECEEDEGTDCEDGDSDTVTLTDKDYVTEKFQ